MEGHGNVFIGLWSILKGLSCLKTTLVKKGVDYMKRLQNLVRETT